MKSAPLLVDANQAVGMTDATNALSVDDGDDEATLSDAATAEFARAQIAADGDPCLSLDDLLEPDAADYERGARDAEEEERGARDVEEEERQARICSGLMVPETGAEEDVVFYDPHQYVGSAQFAAESRFVYENQFYAGDLPPPHTSTAVDNPFEEEADDLSPERVQPQQRTIKRLVDTRRRASGNSADAGAHFLHFPATQKSFFLQSKRVFTVNKNGQNSMQNISSAQNPHFVRISF